MPRLVRPRRIGDLLLVVAVGSCAAEPHRDEIVGTASEGIGSAADYRVPARLDDGWRVASPEDLGLERAPLAKLTALLRADEEYPNVHGLLLAKDGRLVYEEYFAGEDRRYGPDGERHDVELQFDLDTLHDLRSVTKSVTSALVGIAIAAGEYLTVDASLSDLFVEAPTELSSEKRSISIRHALTMTAGLEWNEADVPYSNPANDEMQVYYHVEDAVGYVLDKPVVSQPGAVWTYNSALTMLLGFGLTRTTEEPLRDYAQRVLFEPLGIERWEWRGPPMFKGAPTPAGNLWLRPRDLAKFGALYLERGRWGDEQIVPAEWVDESTRFHIEKTGSSPVEYGDIAEAEHGYGYLWHVDRYRFADGFEIEFAEASGNGGQRVFVVPDLDLLVVHLTGRYNQPGAQWQADRLFLEHLVPWARGVEALPPLPDPRHFLDVDVEAWPQVDLSAAERGRYIGVYDHEGKRTEVWEEDGLLRTTDLAEREGLAMHLVPLGDHVFAFGRYVEGRLLRIYFPQYRIEFEIDEGRASGYREWREGGEVTARAERIEESSQLVR